MNVVEPALELIENHTYLCYTYFHPDHFQIKVCAALFNLYSFVRYGVEASVLGPVTSFYVIARLFAIGLNAFAGSLALAKTSLVAQTRVVALTFCEEHGITAKNSAFDGYTPLYLRLAAYSQDSFADPASDLVPAEGRAFEYVITNSYMSGRYQEGNPDHAGALAYYAAPEERCEKVAAWQAARIEQLGFAHANAAAKIAYLLAPADECLSGPDITIYRLPDRTQM